MASKLPSISENGVAKWNWDVVVEEEEKDVKVRVGESKNGNEDDDVSSSPLWNREDEGWALTWPIWHMLPRDDRKSLAQRHGYKTIGEFEEYMSLHQAMDDSDIGNQPYPNVKIYSHQDEKDSTTNLKDLSKTKVEEGKSKSGYDEKEDNDDDSVNDNTERAAMLDRQASSCCTEDLSLEQLIMVGGKILMLHDEILHQVFAWLPVDTYGTLALVSPHWKHLTRTEAVYRRLCERLYLNQSKRRQLHVSRFGGSYRTMLEQRPRVRAAGGCYVLKYAQIKPIQRDMWTEIPVGAILETVYYRYLYFQEDGRVLYALSSTAPHEMFRRLLKVCLKKTEDPAAVWGTFQVQKNHLTITARQPWHTIRFELNIEKDSIHGRFGALTLTRHLSSPSGCFEDWSDDRVEYQVPVEAFRFVKDPRL